MAPLRVCLAAIAAGSALAIGPVGLAPVAARSLGPVTTAETIPFGAPLPGSGADRDRGLPVGAGSGLPATITQPRTVLSQPETLERPMIAPATTTPPAETPADRAAAVRLGTAVIPASQATQIPDSASADSPSPGLARRSRSARSRLDAPGGASDLGLVSPSQVSAGIAADNAYTVYALGDSLDLFDRVQKLSAAAAFATYRGRTAIAAGTFATERDAQARVRELSRLGVRAELSQGGQIQPASAPIAEAEPMTNRSQPEPSPREMADPAGGWETPSTDSPAVMAQANYQPSRSIAAVSGTMAPNVSQTREDSSRATPPAAASTVAIASPNRNFTEDASSRTGPTGTTGTTTSNLYFLVIQGQPQELMGVADRLLAAGVSVQNISATAEDLGPHLRIGPFKELNLARDWRAALGRSSIMAQIYQNGWLVDAP